MAGYKDCKTATRYVRRRRTSPRRRRWPWVSTGDGKAISTRRTRRVVRAGPDPPVNMKQIGIDVDVKPFTARVQIEKEGTRGEPFDITTEGWIADYAGPVRLHQRPAVRRQHPRHNNNNVAYFNDPSSTSRCIAASQLFGCAALHGVRRARRRHHEERRSVGRARTINRTRDLRVGAHRVLHVPRRLRDGPRRRSASSNSRDELDERGAGLRPAPTLGSLQRR